MAEDTQDTQVDELRTVIDDLDERDAAVVLALLVDNGVVTGQTENESVKDALYRASKEVPGEVAMAAIAVLTALVVGEHAEDFVYEIVADAIMVAILDKIVADLLED